ncbi:hypothetical protein [Desulfonatronovibrio hydrogenovorans]|uniref:hypothetical protein n=1 Tax=Desulfonatronovibrio hydrogenovorans TaxID=53245 RepID=UPI0012947C69
MAWSCQSFSRLAQERWMIQAGLSLGAKHGGLFSKAEAGMAQLMGPVKVLAMTGSS